MNLRPLGPERQPGHFDRGTAWHHVASPRQHWGCRSSNPLNGTAAKPCEAGFVPQVSHDFRARLLLPGQLLTVRQAAERLNISTASLYKLCAQNQVAHVRVGNTIRFNPADVSILVGVKRTTTIRAT